MPLTAGTRLGPYEVVAPLGAGGMGEVYKARDTRLGRSVAIKVLHPSLAADPSFSARFVNEARTLSQIAHPNICVLHDVGEGQPTYIVLEYLEGQTLADRIARGPLAFDEVRRIAVEICRALDTAHRAGIVHRDLKPANVMLTKSGAKLLDFGLAREHRADAADATATMALTKAGTVLGTAAYMAPEQLQGQPRRRAQRYLRARRHAARGRDRTPRLRRADPRRHRRRNPVDRSAAAVDAPARAASRLRRHRPGLLRERA